MKKKSIKKIYEAVGLQLVFVLIMGKIIQSGAGSEIKSDINIYDNTNNEPPPESNTKNSIVQGSGEIYYIYPENLKNFEGDSWELDDYNYGINGWIIDTDLKVENYWKIMMYEPAKLFYLSFKPLRFLFRLILPKEFIIEGYTGEIYCDRYSIPHGIAGVKYRLSGVAKNIKSKSIQKVTLPSNFFMFE